MQRQKRQLHRKHTKQCLKMPILFLAYDFDAEAAASLLEQNGYSDEINGVQEALDKDGNVLGYVITVTAKDGSQGNITFSVGIKNDGTVNGYSITSMSETPGLGIKARKKISPNSIRIRK